MAEPFKALICITSCNRLKEVKKYILDYIKFVNNNTNYHFLLALDGDLDEYKSFSQKYSIPLLYSEKREGVGLSKNRVLTRFPNYDYYFFIEDDVELLNEAIFDLHIEMAKITNYHHLIASNYERVEKVIHHTNGEKIICALHGGGQFNFFTKEGLTKVGGWHDVFAIHRRYGHVEHTQRFVNAGLAPFPFLIIESALKMILIHDPGQVTENKKKHNDSIFIKDEYDLVHKKLTFYPIKTISSFYFNGMSLENIPNTNNILNRKRKYPLLSFKERKKALSERYLNLTNNEKSNIKRKVYFLKFLYFNPFGKKSILFVKNRMNIYFNRINPLKKGK